MGSADSILWANVLMEGVPVSRRIGYLAEVASVVSTASTTARVVLRNCNEDMAKHEAVVIASDAVRDSMLLYASFNAVRLHRGGARGASVTGNETSLCDAVRWNVCFGKLLG